MNEGWREGSAVKNTTRGPGFQSQHSHDNSQTSDSTYRRSQHLLLVSSGTRKQGVHRYMSRQNTHAIFFLNGKNELGVMAWAFNLSTYEAEAADL